jgi:hypothetical protein
MNKEYIKPDMEITMFSNEDVITTSTQDEIGGVEND